MTQKDQAFQEASRFIELLVQLLQLYGVSSQSMVVELGRIVKSLGLNGEFLSTPHFVQTVLWAENEHQKRVNLAVLRSGNYDLGKLVQTKKVAKDVELGSISPSEGVARLREIMLAPALYGGFLNALAFALCGIAFAIIIDSTWTEVMLAGLFSLIAFGITLIAERQAGVAALQEFLVATIVAMLASMITTLFLGINPLVITVCAVVVFIPGFGLTVASRELILGNTLSGIIWLTNALITALKLLSGGLTGLAIAAYFGFGIESVGPTGELDPIWHWVAAPILAMALAILFRANWYNFWAVLLGAALVSAAVQFGSSFGFWQGTFLSAMFLVMYSNACARWMGLPPIVVLLPCIMILVPGLTAIQALYVMGEQGLLAGLGSAQQVSALILSILGGALVGEVIAPHNIVRTGGAVMSLIGLSTVVNSKRKK